MPKIYIELLRHILDECDFILNSFPPLSSKKDLVDDETLKRAVVRSLEIIGEATKKIPVDVKLKWSEIEWKNMAGMRDKLGSAEKVPSALGMSRQSEDVY